MVIVLGVALNILLSLLHICPSMTYTYTLLAQKGEDILRKSIFRSKQEQVFAGAGLVVFVAFASFIVLWFVLWGVYLIHPWAKRILEAVMLCFVLDIGKVRLFATQIYKFVEDSNIPYARKNLSDLAEWDVGEMDEEHIIKTTIETISQKITDGIFGPLFYMLIGGIPLAFVYKAVDIIDSIIGYQNERYCYFGKFAAHFNSFLNFVPARIAAGCLLLASRILQYDYNYALKIFWRDRDHDLSSNHGQVKAVYAGAIGITLGGIYKSFDIIINRPMIGDDTKRADAWDIKKAIMMMYVASAIGVAAALVIGFII